MDRFSTLVQPTKPDEVSPDALRVNKLDMTELMQSPLPSVAFPNFASWVQKFNYGNNLSPFTAPIFIAYNTNFDYTITQRYCKQYGYWDEKREQQKLFNQLIQLDIMHLIFLFTERDASLPNMKLVTVLEWMGASTEGAHKADVDTENAAKIFMRFLKMFRWWTCNGEDGVRRLKLEGCFKDG